MTRRFAVFAMALSPFALCSCWQAAAARAAKKRRHETGYVIGTIEDAAEIDDPLGRKKRAVNFDGDEKNENPAAKSAED